MLINKFSDATPKTLYVSRKVKNGEEIVSWAKSQGFKEILSAKDMHVTIAYSRKPVDWMDVGEQWSSEIKIAEGGPRVIEEFCGGAKVLQFKCSDLEWRNMSIRDAGASWDWPEYHPHITISYGDMPEDVTPYQGKIILGPEVFEEIIDDWKSKADLQDNASSDIKCVMTQKFVDSAKIGTVKRTSEGYVLARSKIARTGVQNYLASELGDIAIEAGFKPDDVVRVYRSPEAVFDAKSLESLTRAPVTIDHPPEMVVADNWAKYAVGEIGDRYKADMEDGWITVDPMIKDAAAIQKTETTHKEWSAGYTAEIVPSTTDIADFDMVNIRFNHLAAVPRGRAGSQARIGDADHWGAAPLTTAKEVPQMEMKAVAIGDKAVQVAANDADTLTKMIADKDTAIGELTAKLADAQSKILTDEQIQAKAKALADAMGRREKVKAKLGDAADKMSDAQIEGALAVIDAMPAAVDDSARFVLGDAMKVKEDNQMEAFYKKKEAKK